MKASEIKSPWARLGFVVLSLMWTATAWFIFILGGFHKTYKYTRETTFVDGAGSLLMAYLFLGLAVIALCIFLQSIGAKRIAYVAVAMVLLLSPCIFLLPK